MSRLIDAHQHLWDPATADYPWLTDELAAIRRRFGPEDLAPELAAAGVDATILVQTRSSLDNTREFLETAAGDAETKGNLQVDGNATVGGSLQISSLTGGIMHTSGTGLVTSGAVSLATEIAGTLPVANGGTGPQSSRTSATRPGPQGSW